MRNAMQTRDDHSFARSMYLLGQIGAIVCHERGPKTDTSILTHMASQPAQGFWLALSSIDCARLPARGERRALLQWKRKEIARLARMLPRPLPESASAQAQMPFWAGYCQYWNDVLKTHVVTAPEHAPRHADDHPSRHVNA
jgi:hypothetical protein